jgi:glycosyltransferase involved in cell wall biosynthesis
MSGPQEDGVLHLVLGPAEHGVAGHALQLAAAAGEPVCHLAAPSPPGADSVLDALRGPAQSRTVHLHVTDRLCGADPETAAELVERIAAHHPLTITLHDLPQVSDGPAGFLRRSAAYRRICAAARGVQVCSHHERELLAAVATCACVVVPLPVPRRRMADRVALDRGVPPTVGVPTVGVLGYLYPGKGHAEVLTALDRSGRPEVALVALGRPSDGHEWLVDDLRRLAGRRSLEVTGYLDDAELDRRILDVTVPVMAHTHVSASGSLHRWIGCGRRPVAVANGYTRELAEALPGALTLTTDLCTALGRALDQPETTWLDRDVELPGIDAAAAAQTEAIRRATAAFR